MNNQRILTTNCVVADHEELAQTLRQAARQADGATAVDFTNIHIVTSRRIEPEFKAVTDRMDYFVPDSRVLTFMIRLAGARGHCHYGPDFMRKFVLSHKEARHYLLGGSQECLDRLIEVLSSEGVNIVGSRHGYHSDEDHNEIIDEINTLSPDYIWVGLGTPRQQHWISRHRDRVKRGVLLAVGYAFDVNAGTKPDAPSWMQKAGIAWVFRLTSEPRRLWWRYLKYNTLFLAFFSLQLIQRLWRREQGQ